MIGRDSPWIGGEGDPFGGGFLAAWDEGIEGGIADLVRPPITTLLDAAALEPRPLTAVITRLIVRGALGGSPSLDHARRRLADIYATPGRARAAGEPPRFVGPPGDRQADERVLALALLMALAVERASGRAGGQA